jgi:hypothetical protein
MLARKLRGFEDCNAPKIYRHFVEGKGTISVKGTRLTVTFPRRAHNPILRNAAWHNLPEVLPGPLKADLALRFS